MTARDYDILDDDFCTYCQKIFPTPTEMQNHVIKEHEGTYAYHSILEAREERDRLPET